MTDIFNREEQETPGVSLQRAREARQWSQNDVAKQLNLSVTWIKCIESDEYPLDTSPIYIRGYLKSYARLVGLPIDPILESFNRLDGIDRLGSKKSLANTSLPIVLTKTKNTGNYKAGGKGGFLWIVLGVVIMGSLYFLWKEAEKKALIVKPKTLIHQVQKQTLPQTETKVLSTTQPVSGQVETIPVPNNTENIQSVNNNSNPSTENSPSE